MEGGAVVDLTNDSGVEDEDVVDLTSPIQVSLTFEPIAIVNNWFTVFPSPPESTAVTNGVQRL